MLLAATLQKESLEIGLSQLCPLAIQSFHTKNYLDTYIN